jgi:L-phenylalanine/L-methionine N-acetyltransferase
VAVPLQCEGRGARHRVKSLVNASFFTCAGCAAMCYSSAAKAASMPDGRKLRATEHSYLAASAGAYHQFGGINPMGTSEEISRRYPKEIELDASLVPPGPQFLRVRPGGQPKAHRSVSVRLMRAADKVAMLQFARSLPQEDLLFLHTDITDPASEDEWIANIERGTTVTLLAEPEGLMAGYVSLHVNSLRWTRRVGEIAINIAPEWRSRGLGEGLCAEIVAVAGVLELRKITAQMVADHKSARALFERLGFHVEALLPDWVEDREGHCRDLLLMAYDLRHSREHAPTRT